MIYLCDSLLFVLSMRDLYYIRTLSIRTCVRSCARIHAVRTAPSLLHSLSLSLSFALAHVRSPRCLSLSLAAYQQQPVCCNPHLYRFCFVVCASAPGRSCVCTYNPTAWSGSLHRPLFREGCAASPVCILPTLSCIPPWGVWACGGRAVLPFRGVHLLQYTPFCWGMRGGVTLCCSLAQS
jgi:hypothetical protein